MAECIGLSLQHLLDATCQLQTRCHSFSNAKRKDLGIAFMLPSLSLSTLLLRLLRTTTTFPSLQPSLRPIPSSKTLQTVAIIFLYCLWFRRSPLLHDNELRLLFVPTISALRYLSTNLSVPILSPPISTFTVSLECSSR